MQIQKLAPKFNELYKPYKYMHEEHIYTRTQICSIGDKKLQKLKPSIN